jgi:hypothetical protein
MTNDEYVFSVIQRYSILTGPYSPAEQSANALAPYIRRWAGNYLANIFFSGSYAKGTGVRGSTDIDIFISLSSNLTTNLGDIYSGLFDFALKQGWNPRKQNVSIGIQYLGQKIDLIPGQVQAGYQNYHSLYRSKVNSWTQTNVALQTKLVRESGRTNEIRAIKIWRNLRNLEFPSFFLELMVIQALRGRRIGALADNVLEAIRFVANNLIAARIIDPSNTNNIISDDLTIAEKQFIVAQANSTLRAGNWNQVVW